MTSTPAAQILEAVSMLLDSLVTDVRSHIDSEGSKDAKLANAERALADIDAAAGAINARLDAARADVQSRVQALQGELDDEALARVAHLLGSGAVSLADLASRAGVQLATAPREPAASEQLSASVAPPQPPQPQPVVPQPEAVVQDAPLEVRRNLRLQAGYLNSVRFRDPATGQGWSGRGPAPKWLKALCGAGKAMEDYRVQEDGTTIASAPVEPAPITPIAQAAPAPAPTTDAQPQEAVSAPESVVTPTSTAPGDSSDIGSVMSFDASGFEPDLNGGSNDNEDIGDFGDDLMGAAAAPGAAATSSFSANA